MQTAVCAGCQQEKPIKAKGYCRACYQQWKRTGSTARERMPRGQCTVPGCDKPAHGKGVCDMHIKRMKVSGSYDDPRADNVNLKTNQATYVQWMTYRRGDGYPIVQEWFDDFFVFFAAVGERPSPRHRLNRLDKSKPMGPGNFEWREKITTRHPEEDSVEYADRYRQARRDTLGTSLWDGEYKAKYGISLQDFQAMLKAQGGVCAILGTPEVHTRGGRVRAMSVDHDHKTGVPRQLLTSAANTLLGAANDEPMVLAKAILYLVKHAPVGGQRMLDEVVAYLETHPVASLDKDAVIPQS